MNCLECHYPRLPDSESPEAFPRQKAQACAANLKYIGLAARTWAGHNDAGLPFSFAIMANELRSPSILICPVQTNAHAMQPWEFLAPKPTWMDATYQIVSPWRRRRDPGSVYVRCPIHGTALCADGSVVLAAENQ